MTTSRCTFLLTFMLLTVASATVLGDEGPAAPSRRKVAVLDFAVSGVPAEQKTAISSSLSAVVAAEVAAQGHDVVTLEDIKAMVSFEKFKYLTGCESDTSCLAEIGGALGTDLMITGTVGRLGGEYKVALSLVDSQRASVVKRFQGTAGSPEVLADTVRRGVQILFGKKQDLSGRGTLFIKTEPPGAEVFVDGKKVGVSPVTVDGLAAGDHRVTARSADLSGEATVLLHPEAIERVQLALHAAPPVKLKVFSSPPEAEVFVDGERVGTTPLMLGSVASGRHQFVIRLAHHDDAEVIKDLSFSEYEKAGREPFKVEVRLKPTPVEMLVVGAPEGATISLDGTPLNAPFFVVPGARRFRCELHGYKVVEQVLVVAPGEAARIDVAMEMLPEYRDFLDTRERHTLLGAVALASGVALAAASAGGLMWAYLMWGEAEAAHEHYLQASTVADMDARYALVQEGVEGARIRQGAGIGLAVVSALSLAGSAVLFLTSPEDPLASELAIPAPGQGADPETGNTASSNAVAP